MNKARTRGSKRTPRGSWVAVVLLLGAYIVQPALGLLSDCLDRDCGSLRACCCAEPATPTPAPAPSPAQEATGCCATGMAEDPPPAEEGRGDAQVESECGCRADSIPSPAPDPSLPPRSEGLGDGALGEWIRAHAQAFARIAHGPPGPPGPPAIELAGPDSHAFGGVPGAGSPRAPERAGTLSFGLLARGVGGFLALLSIARL